MSLFRSLPLLLIAAVSSASGIAPPGRATYIVVFREAPLARYHGDVPGLPAAGRTPAISGRSRLDVAGPEAAAYIEFLLTQQALHEREMTSAIGNAWTLRLRMQHALNAVVVDLTDEEAKQVAQLPAVLQVEREHLLAQHTDVGPTLIGAATVWAGTNEVFASGFESGEMPPPTQPPRQGEGMVVGIIDSGINFGSPSFAGVDPIDGYVHINPFGSGVFRGTCEPGGVDQGRCNEKLIGGYDFVCGAPANQCGQANVREEPGFGDTNGHGTHVASISAGNRRDAVLSDAILRISGVAPRANLIVYDACYTNTSTGQGLCPSTSTAAAVNQAIADGVVDVINYSISGGTSPWSDTTSAAFLSAVNAGIFVAVSAGNNGPTAESISHVEPWTATVAAAQHGRGNFANAISVTGPHPVPGDIATLFANQSTGGAQLLATIPGTTPLVVSPDIDTTGDGCAAYAANQFAGAIALVRRGTCSFSIKINNAATAGAIAVIIANNQTGSLVPSAPGTTIPAFSFTQVEGDAVRDFGQANPATTTAQIDFPAVGMPTTPDALGSFSSRGPVAGGMNLLKPDVTAPGVRVLGAYAGTTLTGSENLVTLLDGTSMASPHLAGAALLVRQAQPTWTPIEVKSALMMASKRPVLLEDQVTLASPHAAGSGRVQVDHALRVGLVLDETQANFTAANPALGGEPGTLNLPSLANSACIGSCGFTRTFRSVRVAETTWQVALNGLTGTVPATLTIAAGATADLVVTIDTSGLPADGLWKFGGITLTELDDQGTPLVGSDLYLPVGVVVP